ncbi:hypothetical protein FHS78_003326 [Parvibaculum indicum]|uniref:SIMPL domain-containing protein n=1 Tax=Parvibaculum indicum TaxID=562969 RepID=UPI00141DE9EF|nr:SIMPL domain-containing protein [Parvibaculum indicum]NIJ43018.1 hypothetical protein [Parvibaculum indicum]
MNNVFTVVAAAILGVGIALGGFFGGQGLVESRLGDRSVTVKGLSERDVKADLALWPIRFVATGGNVEGVQAQIAVSTKAVVKFLKNKGFSDDEISVESPEVTDRMAQAYRSGPVDVRFIISQLVMVRSTDVEKVATANRSAGDLVSAGIVLSSDRGPSRPSYLFKSLNKVKGEMIEEAMSRAKQAAETFASDSGTRLNGIRRAYQGQFQILPRDNAPGIQQSEQIEKTVRVVSTIEYLLAN